MKRRGWRCWLRSIQPRETPDPAYFIGRGKLEELEAIVSELKVEAVIFDNDLTPAQTRNLEKALDIVVVDRTSLILQIFAQRAQTKAAKLQVDLAQLQYALPRLTRLWTHLSRLGTGGVVRGPGETQLQIDRRLIRTQISRVKKALQKVEKHRRVQRKQRQEMINVSLVGYTNAGKSTLFNALTSEKQLAEDKLFATLDPTTRTLDLPDNQHVLLSDTVGFLKKLPHHLVDAFKATLEEVAEADLLLHIVDVAHPEAESQIDAVDEVLKELGALERPTLMLFNKIDLLEEEGHIQLFQSKYPDSLAISAQNGAGLEALKELLAERFSAQDVDVSLALSYQDGKALDYLYKHGEVFDTDYQGESIKVKAKLPQRYLKALDRLTTNSTSVILNPKIDS
ncbi:GTPase HflX [Geodia barretti]|uniref:GTPase HflX n=1 Tax=Geodia barretti TaxID=519541 RepID=A0AA35SAQ6_GEOBA|nr:GTPase HflX [Geodia barretti]